MRISTCPWLSAHLNFTIRHHGHREFFILGDRVGGGPEPTFERVKPTVQTLGDGKSFPRLHPVTAKRPFVTRVDPGPAPVWGHPLPFLRRGFPHLSGGQSEGLRPSHSTLPPSTRSKTASRSSLKDGRARCHVSRFARPTVRRRAVPVGPRPTAGRTPAPWDDLRARPRRVAEPV